MPLLFPIAATPREALDAGPDSGARTIAEARELAKGPVALVSDWLRPSPAEAADVQRKAESGIARGFVQVYEDAKGRPVIAVTYWKPGAEKAPPAPRARPTQAAGAPPEDHTDDLYFTKADAKAKRKRKAIDPNQLDMFGLGQKNADDADSPGPGGVIVDEDSAVSGDSSGEEFS
jgi:hypothetical protein